MTQRQHDNALEQLLDNLALIDETEKHIKWLFQEPRWYLPLQKNEHKLCDIILKYDDGTGGAIELKRSPKGSRKGRQQLHNGEYLLQKEFNIPYVRKKLVYYHRLPVWEYELVENKNYQ